ncbi:retropepsin-like aspartic protease [Azonexus hydrophilus]|uniref:Retropepsin-like aspartic protease n=1 Tax=Azonexus hydrophilus TaxID=418702 RepID=A0ABZ2XL20_9RHOO
MSSLPNPIYLAGCALIAVGIAGYWVIDAPKQPTAMASVCHALPVSNSTAALDGGMLQRTGNQKGLISFSNRTPKPIVATMGNAQSGKDYQVVVINPNTEGSISMPVGYYGLTVMRGEEWCNLDIGFKNGIKYQINGGISVAPNSGTEIRINHRDGVPNTAIDFHAFPLTLATAAGGISIPRSEGGYYMTPGQVNGVGVNFMVDTGATHVTVPAAVAERAGIACQTPAMFQTPGGAVKGCMGMAKAVTFGPFIAHNTEVAIIENNETTLLGMNLLASYRISQSGNTMHIQGAGGAGAVDASRQKVPEIAWDETPHAQAAGTPVRTRDPIIWALISALGLALSIIGALLDRFRKQQKLLKVTPAD